MEEYLGGIKRTKVRRCHYIVVVFYSVFVRCFARLQSPNTEIGTELWDREAGEWEALDGLICNGATCWEDMGAQLYCHGMGYMYVERLLGYLNLHRDGNEQADKDWHHFEK